MRKPVHKKPNSEDNLHQALLMAVESPKHWQKALQILAQDCGALAAIITLRDNKNAQIVISTEIATEYHTPYVGGFPKEMVEIYVAKFRYNDPWSKVQSRSHPFEPKIMSHHLPIADFAKTGFGTWVSKDIFNDTVVVEIGSSPNYWTALNLYFMNQDPDQAIEVRDALKSKLSDFKKAWTLSRRFQQNEGFERLITEYVASHPKALFLLNSEGRMISHSGKAHELISKGIVKIQSPKNQFKISSDLSYEPTIKGLVDVFKDDGNNGMGYSAKLDKSHENLISTGEKLGLSILSIEHWRDSEISPWENDCLTEREKLLALTIAQTDRISEGAKMLGVGERRNRQIWTKVQEKLGGITKEELVTHYKNTKIKYCD